MTSRLPQRSAEEDAAADARPWRSEDSRTGDARTRLVLFTGRLISCALLFLGILGMLRTGSDDFGGDSAEQLWIFTVHPLTAVVWTILGVAGVAMVARPAWAGRYLAFTGVLLLAWGVLGLALDGSASQLFVRDVPLVVMHLAGGVICLAAVLAPLPGRGDGPAPE